MKDAKDLVTIDAFAVKKRGRPSTGSAMTPAQRMAAKRERDRLVVSTARYQDDFEVLTNMALIEALADAVKNKCPQDVRKISAVLVKRAKE